MGQPAHSPDAALLLLLVVLCAGARGEATRVVTGRIRVEVGEGGEAVGALVAIVHRHDCMLLLGLAAVRTSKRCWPPTIRVFMNLDRRLLSYGQRRPIVYA